MNWNQAIKTSIGFVPVIIGFGILVGLLSALSSWVVVQIMESENLAIWTLAILQVAFTFILSMVGSLAIFIKILADVRPLR